jgi:glycosyltransferase involved in cell wall biosynthesis
VVCGSAATSNCSDDYVDRVLRRLAVLPWVRVVSFVDAAALFALFSNSVLNVHPAAYDAFGMTIMEAAAAGCPSLVGGAHVGATHLLGAGAFVAATDLGNVAVTASQVRCVSRNLVDPIAA